MKKPSLVFVSLFALIASALSALAEPVKLSRAEARDLDVSIANFDAWLMNGQELQVADGDKQRVIRKPYELDAATRFALAKAKRAVKPISDEISAVNNAKVAEVTPPVTDKNPQGQPSVKDMARVDAEFRPFLADKVTLDLTLIDAGVFNRFGDKLPITILTGLDPILKNKP